MKKIILLIIFITLLIPSVLLSQNWNGVSVGYNPFHGELLWSVNDATDMRQYLIDYKQWVSIKITQLTDPTELNINNAVSSMPRTVGNTNLFYFSGYGS